jgi:hypothetical protein
MEQTALLFDRDNPGTSPAVTARIQPNGDFLLVSESESESGPGHPARSCRLRLSHESVELLIEALQLARPAPLPSQMDASDLLIFLVRERFSIRDAYTQMQDWLESRGLPYTVGVE